MYLFEILYNIEEAAEKWLDFDICTFSGCTKWTKEEDHCKIWAV